MKLKHLTEDEFDFLDTDTPVQDGKDDFGNDEFYCSQCGEENWDNCFCAEDEENEKRGRYWLLPGYKDDEELNEDEFDFLDTDEPVDDGKDNFKVDGIDTAYDLAAYLNSWGATPSKLVVDKVMAKGEYSHDDNPNIGNFLENTHGRPISDDEEEITDLIQHYPQFCYAGRNHKGVFASIMVADEINCGHDVQIDKETNGLWQVFVDGVRVGDQAAGMG